MASATTSVRPGVQSPALAAGALDLIECLDATSVRYDEETKALEEMTKRLEDACSRLRAARRRYDAAEHDARRASDDAAALAALHAAELCPEPAGKAPPSITSSDPAEAAAAICAAARRPDPCAPRPAGAPAADANDKGAFDPAFDPARPSLPDPVSNGMAEVTTPPAPPSGAPAAGEPRPPKNGRGKAAAPATRKRGGR